MNCINGCNAPRYPTKRICVSCVAENNKSRKASTTHYQRHRDAINAARRVEVKEKPGPKFKVSYEDAVDAFGRIKDGELHVDLCAELGVSDKTLRDAFVRVGLIDQRAAA
jgi:hypothetical protein